MASKELTGVVSVDLEPEFEFYINAAAKGMEVIDEESFQAAAIMIQQSAACIAQVEQFFEKDKSLAHALHKSICDKITKFTASWRTVRPLLEPKMKAFRKRVEDERIAREREQARIAEEARQKAEQEARRIQAEADERAAELRRQGEMRAAREVVATAAEQATSVVEQADSLAELGTIEPAPAKLVGVSDSLPWIGEVTSIEAICKAIGNGSIPLKWLTPTRGQGEQYLPLVEINQSVLNNIAKRMGKEDLQIPGAKGIREVQLRFSKSVAKTQEDEW